VQDKVLYSKNGIAFLIDEFENLKQPLNNDSGKSLQKGWGNSWILFSRDQMKMTAPQMINNIVLQMIKGTTL